MTEPNGKLKTVEAVVVRCDFLEAGVGGAFASANARAATSGKTTIPSGGAQIVPFSVITYDDDGAGGTRFDAGTYTYTNGATAALHAIDVTLTLQPAGATANTFVTLNINGAPAVTTVWPALAGSYVAQIHDRLNVPAGGTVSVFVNNATDNVDVATGSAITIRSLGPSVS